ncbi:hypothetical protein Y5S_01960 [Alcanivorax nanhaiticus]|uniref:Uncharacterized protein n=1 Tax=Alcanivorax nanhaiticus TaxID=1177154 RepID=A0A095SJX5_9GAMM|nr:hypothetical protein [Alcanivorax nanhaiticus]KGD64594.1 hypothetical protein Y5S_01960 [Alcanivorax nanhaiticus]
MTTTLKPFSDAYATLTVASYEPLFLRWISGGALLNLSAVMANRMSATAHLSELGDISTVAALSLSNNWNRQKLPSRQMLSAAIDKELAKESIDPMDISSLSPRRLKLKAFPDAVQVGDRILLNGVDRLRPMNLDVPGNEGVTDSNNPGLIRRAFRMVRKPVGNSRKTLQQRKTPAVVFSGMAIGADDSLDFHQARLEILKGFDGAIGRWLEGRSSLDEAIKKDVLGKAFGFFPGRVEEALSPIGIAHYYRQLFFNTEEGFGPIEESFTVAPAETLEVITETVRRQSFEEINEVGLVTESEQAREQRNLDEVSDRTATMVRNSSEVAISANFSGQVGVYQFGADVSTNFNSSRERNTERTKKRLKETTFRASERIRKSVSVRTRSFEETTTTNSSRRLIQNNGDTPVNYGLRRVLRKVRVKVQDLGPRMVWQLYVRNPGAGLARSKFVHFREGQDISIPDVPPGTPPKPEGGQETGTTSATLEWSDSRGTWYVPIGVVVPSGRSIDSVAIDSITDLESGGKEDHAPSPRNDISWHEGEDPDSGLFVVAVGVSPGDSHNVNVSYTYSWSPSSQAILEWEATKEQLREEIREESLQKKFERERTLITERSKIPKRPAADLRQEERYEIMNRMVSHLFANPANPSEPTPTELEYFHRYFDLNGIFLYMHPSWWRPRYAASATGLERPPYEITAESDPAPLGSSLKWAIQLDGDNRRNEFLNSPWVRVCVPINPGNERDAIQWLAEHIEGDRGYDIESGPLKAVLESIESRRNDEESVPDGPDYAVVSGTPGAPDEAATPQDIYPIVDEFDVTVPTAGFVYDKLILNKE